MANEQPKGKLVEQLPSYEAEICVPAMLNGEKTILEGREFYSSDGIAKALWRCQEGGYEALSMPSFIDTRIKATKDALVWRKETSYNTTSIRAIGETKRGNIVVVVAHVPSYLSNPDNIKEIGYVQSIPPNEFQRLLRLEDEKRVFVFDFEHTLKRDKCIELIPLLGGEERAEKYLKKHKEVYGREAGIWGGCAWAEFANRMPVGCLWHIGYQDIYGFLGHGVINFTSDLMGHGRFIGVKTEGKKLEFLLSSYYK